MRPPRHPLRREAAARGLDRAALNDAWSDCPRRGPPAARTAWPVIHPSIRRSPTRPSPGHDRPARRAVASTRSNAFSTIVPCLEWTADGNRERKSTVREYYEALLIAVIFVNFARIFVFQAFKIPTGSMEDNLKVGDHIIVNKFIYGPVPQPGAASPAARHQARRHHRLPLSAAARRPTS